MGDAPLATFARRGRMRGCRTFTVIFLLLTQRRRSRMHGRRIFRVIHLLLILLRHAAAAADNAAAAAAADPAAAVRLEGDAGIARAAPAVRRGSEGNAPFIIMIIIVR